MLPRKLKYWLVNKFSGFSIVQSFVGGVRYYCEIRENFYKPEQFLHYGKRVRIESGTSIAAAERLHVGDDVGIGQKCYINAVGGCHIGRGCQIAQETIILTTEHQYTGGQALPFDPVRLVKPVVIEDYVWIGMRTCIAPGVRIGEGAIVGMGSIVTQDVPPLAIVAGNPAKVVMFRGKESFEALKAKGSVIDTYAELPMLKVPPITKRKYKSELMTFGFDVSNGQEYFYYDKRQKLSQRLVPVKGPVEPGTTPH